MLVYLISQGAVKTRRLGAIFADELLRTKPGKRAIIISLNGELGSGKTTFVQGLAKTLGAKRRITSPTFLLARAYPARRGRVLYHIDCYRVTSAKDLAALGWRDWVSRPDNIIIVEWAEKIKGILPRNTMYMEFKHGKKRNERIITIKDNNL
jgi:tRNA threonylcarbamoyladenosine biosynthesis protein TsaE